MGNWRERGCYTEVIPFTAMITVECTNVGLSTIFKAATLKGLNFHVFMLYTYGIAASLLLPLCFFFRSFVSQYLGYVGIEYSTPTLASAMTNLTPASTFVLAVLLRMEKLEMKSLSTQVKIIGTLITIAGALLVVLYEGPVLIRSPTASASVSEQQPAIAMITAGAEQSDWVKGGALLAAQYVMVSLWYIFQAKAVARYPAELVVVFFYNLSCMIIAAPVCLIEVSNSSAWNIFRPDVRLYSVLYGGLMGSCFGVLVHTWGLHIKGPVYVALFKPLSIAIAAVMGFIFLGDDLYLGCLIGSLIISFGFYVLMWAKAQEVNGQTSQKRAEFVESSAENAPLLEAYHGSTSEEFQTATV
ncbi:WAT1-related protein At5g40230 isoform X2 [Coffea arabica]|uniref:WAT1-related protein n=1 Tax=Coffea arabica TaxID=13443 RepID=A0ABM4V5A7_COFAR